MTSTSVERCEPYLADLSRPPEEVAALRDAIAEIPDRAAVRGAYVYLVLDTFAPKLPDAVARARADLTAHRITYFGTIGYGYTTGLIVWLGHKLWPELSCVDASNRVARALLQHHHENPILAVLKTVSDHSMRGYLANFHNFESLIWNFRATDIDASSDGVVMTVRSPYGRCSQYTAPGFMRGLQEVLSDMAIVRAEVDEDGDLAIEYR